MGCLLIIILLYHIYLEYDIVKFESSDYPRKDLIILCYSDNLDLFKKYHKKYEDVIILLYTFRKSFKQNNLEILKYLLKINKQDFLIILCSYHNILIEHINLADFGKCYVLGGLFMRGDEIAVNEYISEHTFNPITIKQMSGAAYKFPHIIWKYKSFFESFMVAGISQDYEYIGKYSVTYFQENEIHEILAVAHEMDDPAMIKVLIKQKLITASDVISTYNTDSVCYKFLKNL